LIKISLRCAASSENAAIPVPTLEFGTLALRNAELLLNKLTVPNSTEGICSIDQPLSLSNEFFLF
jgi:hypothetical protein